MITNQYGTYKEHGHRHTRLYNIWSGLKARCNRRNNPDYKLYGERGIRVCDEWNDFMKFYDWQPYNNGLMLQGLRRIPCSTGSREVGAWKGR